MERDTLKRFAPPDIRNLRTIELTDRTDDRIGLQCFVETVLTFNPNLPGVSLFVEFRRFDRSVESYIGPDSEIIGGTRGSTCAKQAEVNRFWANLGA